MKVNNWLVISLVLVGFMVFAMSLYSASLAGVMGKMGLVGGDFNASVDTNELARSMRAQKSEVSCDLWNVVDHIPSYLLSRGEERVRLSNILSTERIVCGIRLVQAENVERGVYAIIKGLYYLRSHYAEMGILVQSDPSKCSLLGEPTNENLVESYLGATKDRVHQVVLEIYKQVELSRGAVEGLCLD